MIKQLETLDAQIFFFLNGLNHPLLDPIFYAITQFGSGFFLYPALLWVLIKFVKEQNKKQIIIFALIAFIAAGFTTSFIKKKVNRLRPIKQSVKTYEGHIQNVLFRPWVTPFYEQDVHVVGKPIKYKSFPSGHTSGAFAAGTILILILRLKRLPVYMACALIGYSRIYIGAHFPGDVLAGAFLGIIIPLLILKPLLKQIRN